jgi:hypothetical protein
MTTATTVPSRTQGDRSFPTNPMTYPSHVARECPTGPVAIAMAAGTARASISQSRRDAGNTASRQNAIASYQGRCSGHTSSQASRNTKAGRMTGRCGGPAGSRQASTAATATQPSAANSSSPRGILS